jgi:hypothetical protein
MCSFSFVTSDGSIGKVLDSDLCLDPVSLRAEETNQRKRFAEEFRAILQYAILLTLCFGNTPNYNFFFDVSKEPAGIAKNPAHTVYRVTQRRRVAI